MEGINRALSTTFKQIKRSGWLAGASIAVMSLAVIVSSIFGVLAYASNLFLDSVEREPQIYAFFEVGTPDEKIQQFKTTWESLKGVAYVEYTSEAQAKQEFYLSQKDVNQLAADAIESHSFPASLAIRLNSLNFAEDINNTLIDAQTNNSEIKTIRYSKDVTENIREVFTWIRIGGAVILGMLLIVIVLFTLLTVEFRMHSRSEEIEIMQLVGGSLGYIRMPFILEGAVYGMLGALISNIISGILALVLYIQLKNNQLSYLRDLLQRISWPELGVPHLVGGFLLVIFIAGLLGAFNSFIAIRRYIK